MILSDEDREKAEKHFFTNVNTAVWAWRDTTSKPYIGSYQQNHGGCHGGSFHLLGKYCHKMDFFASCAALPKGRVLYYDAKHTPPEQLELAEYVDDICQEYLEWLFSDKSPWVSIHKNDIELIRDKDNRIRAFVLGPSAINVDNRAGILNLCIASRMTRDKHYLFEQMINLRKLGIDFLRSFFLMGMISFNKNTHAWYPSHGWQGSHEPLKNRWGTPGIKDKYGYPDHSKAWEEWKNRVALSFDKFQSGGYVPTDCHSHTEGWGVDVPEGKNDLISDLHGVVSEVKTRFSKIKLIEPDNIVKFAESLS